MRSPSEYYGRLTLDNFTPFRPARIKLKRAYRHILEVREMAGKLAGHRGHEFLIGTEQKSGKLQLICMGKDPMPLEFDAAVGDAIHCLRATFDYVAVALTAPHIGTGDPRHAYFPTGIDHGEFIRARDGFTTVKGKRVDGKMEGATADGLRLVEELEPYNGGKYSLRALHDLDIIDKHKLIVPATAAITIRGLSLSVDDEKITLGATDFKANDDGSNLAAVVDIPFTLDRNFKFNDDFQATYEIVFGKGQPLAGRPILDSLFEFADVADGFIKACETAFPGQIREMR